jgi:hypothetical protein
MEYTMKTSSLLSAVLAGILSLSIAAPVFAVSAPNFPLCTNPQGSLKVSYANGVHGIVGSTATYEGSDTVYDVSDTTAMQCFCSVSGSGIQTNWWNAGSLSEEQIAQLKSEGWYYVANGGLWGLDSDPYMAQNLNYSCLSRGGGTGGPGDGLSDGRSDGRSSCPTCTQGGIGGGDVLGISTDGQVLGLASTGDMLKILALFGYSAIFFYIGVKLSHKKSA